MPKFVPDVEGAYCVQLIVNDGQENSSPDVVTVTTNVRPVADAGPDLAGIAAGQTMTLDGSSSHDADGDSLTFDWAFTTRPAGSSAVLDDATAVKPSFVADAAGTYVLRLIVNDGHQDSLADTVSITTEAVCAAPVARAGTDQSATLGQTVTLDGSQSSSCDDRSLIYKWSLISRPDGSAAALSGSWDGESDFHSGCCRAVCGAANCQRRIAGQ